MTLIMDPQPGESVYDPTCGSGGLLLNCALQLKEAGKEYRTLKLYGQEINLITSAIARMNMFMHGIEEFQIVRGDTLSEPKLLENDTLKTFNVILANPPYSIKAWNRAAFESDPWGRNLWGRNLWGVPPQGCADYAFQQHIQKSLDSKNGRSISLWPHGILFRDAEQNMRRQMIERDVVECVIGLGPNLFYNSPMEACLLVTNTNKPKKRRGKILVINAVKEVRQDKNMGFLEEKHIQKIYQAFRKFEDQDDLAKLLTLADVEAQKFNLAISRYIRPERHKAAIGEFGEALENWVSSSDALSSSMNQLFATLEKGPS